MLVAITQSVCLMTEACVAVALIAVKEPVAISLMPGLYSCISLQGGFNNGGTSYLGNAEMRDCGEPRIQTDSGSTTLSDWRPIAQARNGSYLASEFDRTLNPLDNSEDYPILNASIPVIWAVHSTR